MYLGQRVEKTEAGGLGTGGIEPALLNSLPAGATALSAQVQGPLASKDLISLYHDSGSGIWIWMLMKRQDHFNSHAANYITDSCQSLNPYECPVSEVQVLSNVASFDPHGSPGGTLMTIIPS